MQNLKPGLNRRVTTKALCHVIITTDRPPSRDKYINGQNQLTDKRKTHNETTIHHATLDRRTTRKNRRNQTRGGERKMKPKNWYRPRAERTEPEQRAAEAANL